MLILDVALWQTADFTFLTKMYCDIIMDAKEAEKMGETLSQRDLDMLEHMKHLEPMERLGKAMYEAEPSQLLQPIRSQEDLDFVLEQMELLGVSELGKDILGQFGEGFFSPNMTEDRSIEDTMDIAVGLHPRFMGNAPHYHDFFELTYLCCGTMTQTIAGQEITLVPGDLTILCPGVAHDMLSVNQENVMLTIRLRRSTFYNTFFTLFSKDDVLYRYFHNILFNDRSMPWLLFRTGDDQDILRICLDMYHENMNVNGYCRQYLNLQMSLLFLRLLRDYCGHLTIGDSGSHKDNLALILQYISANCREATLAQTAETFHYNASYLSRVLKSTFGKSFLEIRTEIRLEKAAELLKNSQMPVPSIAVSVGYDSTGHFNKIFKGRFGVSPSAYRGNESDAG